MELSFLIWNCFIVTNTNYLSFKKKYFKNCFELKLLISGNSNMQIYQEIHCFHSYRGVRMIYQTGNWLYADLLIRQLSVWRLVINTKKIYKHVQLKNFNNVFKNYLQFFLHHFLIYLLYSQNNKLNCFVSTVRLHKRNKLKR